MTLRLLLVPTVLLLTLLSANGTAFGEESMDEFDARMAELMAPIELKYFQSSLQLAQSGVSSISTTNVNTDSGIHFLISIVSQLSGGAMSCKKPELKDKILTSIKDFLSAHSSIPESKISPTMRHIESRSEAELERMGEQNDKLELCQQWNESITKASNEIDFLTMSL